jgi:hypothetical protein
LIRGVLNTIALTFDGKPAAATTIARKRAVVCGVLNYAVESDLLPANPIDKDSVEGFPRWPTRSTGALSRTTTRSRDSWPP